MGERQDLIRRDAPSNSSRKKDVSVSWAITGWTMNIVCRARMPKTSAITEAGSAKARGHPATVDVFM